MREPGPQLLRAILHEAQERPVNPKSDLPPGRILVLSADRHSANLGVRVLADGMASLARKAWGAQVVVDFQNFVEGDSEINFGGRSIVRDIGRPNGAIKQKLRQYDLILESGAGDSFADIYGIKRLVSMHYMHRLASRNKVPVIMGPQTIGPFRTQVGKLIAKRSLRSMQVVVSRDSISAEHSSRLGRAVDARSTDVVFALPVPEPLASRNGVIINVSGLLWNENPHVDYQIYRREIVSLGHRLVSQGQNVRLMAHVLENPSIDNDVPAVRQVASQLPGATVIIPESLEDARTQIASASLVIGSRMHACLNAISVGTPAISWAYSRKFEPLLQDIGWSFNLDLREIKNPAAQTFEMLATMKPERVKVDLESCRKSAEDRLGAAACALATVSGRGKNR